MKAATESEVGEALRSLALPDPRVVVSGNFASPRVLMQILDQSLERYRLFALNPQAPWPRREGVATESPFLGPGVRGDPAVHYLPARLSLVPRLFTHRRRPNVVLVQTSTPRDGKVSLGIEVNILPAAIEAVRHYGGVVVAEMNPQMPYTFGDGEIALEMFDLLIESDCALPSPTTRRPDAVARAIGENIVNFVPDGATLQLGIGEIPDAAVGQLSQHRQLAIWSEMISDGVLTLERAGAMDRERPITCSFLFGSPELYQWSMTNRRLVMRRTELVNDPATIESRPLMVSINAAIEIDLFAQANATHVNGQIYSGFGGQPDFVSGALHSRGGHALIAVRSWHDKSASSNVVPLLTSPVCTFQHSVLVSEQGSAEIFGLTRSEQSALIIEKVADPRAHDELRDAAQRWG